MAYLYKHIRLDNNEIFYIGIGTKEDNYKRSSSKSGRSKWWKNIVNKYDMHVISQEDFKVSDTIIDTITIFQKI